MKMKFVIGMACGYMVRSLLDSDSLREKSVNYLSGKIEDVMTVPMKDYPLASKSRITYNNYSTYTPFSIRPRIKVDSRDGAENVIEALSDIIDRYGVAKITDLHDLVGLPNIYRNEQYGWTTMKGVNIIPDQNGFRINLPEAKKLITMEINSKEQK